MELVNWFSILLLYDSRTLLIDYDEEELRQTCLGKSSDSELLGKLKLNVNGIGIFLNLFSKGLEIRIL